jgi:hypothetical protein
VKSFCCAAHHAQGDKVKQDPLKVCSICNWVNATLINLGNPGEERLVCQGCCKRAVEMTESKRNPVWEYSPFSASIRKNGKLFAIATPDGVNHLNKDDAKLLIDALNAHEQAHSNRDSRAVLSKQRDGGKA